MLVMQAGKGHYKTFTQTHPTFYDYVHTEADIQLL